MTKAYCNGYYFFANQNNEPLLNMRHYYECYKGNKTPLFLDV